jgi:uncharacterized repeat protein (TIGR01451 family)
MSFLLQSSKSIKIKARFFGKVEGAIVKNKNGFVITSDEKLMELKPALVIQTSSEGNVQIDVTKKGKNQNVVVATGAITLQPDQKINVLKFEIAGTSISFNKYIATQADNIKKYFSEKKTAPNIAVVTLSEKPKTAPRDTMMYIIYYHNIGTAPAIDVNIAGQVPAGTKLLEGSAIAEFKDVEINYDRKKAEPPQVGEVIGIKWIDKSKINPGEERWVKYSVVID